MILFRNLGLKSLATRRLRERLLLSGKYGSPNPAYDQIQRIKTNCYSPVVYLLSQVKKAIVDQYILEATEQEYNSLFHGCNMVEENSQTSGVFSGLPYTKVVGNVEDIVLALPVNDSSSMKNCDGSYDVSLQGKEPTFNENQQIYSISAENLEYTGPCLLHEDLSPEVLNVYTISDSTYDNLAISNDRLPQPKPDTLSSILEPYPETNSPLSFWSNCPLDLETMKMDDVFQVDKDDLVQSPTLAELNANDESLFDSFDNFDTVFPSEHMSQKTKSVSSASDEQYDISVFDLSAVCTNTNPLRASLEEKQKFHNVPGNANLSYSKELETAEPTNKFKSESSLHGGEVKLQTVPTVAQPYEMQVNNLTDVHEHCKVKMDINGRESESITVLKHEQQQQVLVHDDPESDEESELDCDYSTEPESEDEKREENPDEVLLEKKKKRYFWQYNVQAKGPKTMKLSINGKCDPVFNADSSEKGVRHAGKARRGDGNDLTPNPKKLYHIGLELRKLNSVIDELVPANELPLNARINSRKEKNKLASRACRLKKKAQHEANKLKLFGLQQERKHLLQVVTKAKKLIKKRIQNGVQREHLLLEDAIESFIRSEDITKVAGCSADFVNNALKKVGAGDNTGGLNIDESS